MSSVWCLHRVSHDQQGTRLSCWDLMIIPVRCGYGRRMRGLVCAAVLDDIHDATVWSLAVAPSRRRFLSASADQSLAIHRCYSTAVQEKKQSGGASGTTNVMKQKSKPTWLCVGTLPDAHASVAYDIDYAPSLVPVIVMVVWCRRGR